MAMSEQKIIYNIYALFGVSIVFSVVPSISAAFVSALFFLIALIAAYVVRGRSDTHSLTENHMIYVIRTIWIASLFAIVTMGFAAAYMLPKIEYLPLQSCMNALASQGTAALESMGIAEAEAIIAPCMEDFMAMNYQVFLVAAFIAGGPLIVYLGYRFVKGIARAAKGYRLADPKGWF